MNTYRRIFCVLISVVVLVPGGFVVQGQGPTATPSFEVFREHQLAFPQLLRSEISFALPASELARLRLIIEPEDRSPFEVRFGETIPPNSAPGLVDSPFVFANEYVVARYDWQIPSLEPPILFGEIRITWDIITNRDERFQIVDTLVYEDNRASWQIAQNETETIIVGAPRGFDIRPGEMVAELSRVYDFLAARTDQQPRFRLLLYPPDLPVGCGRDEVTDEPVVYLRENNLPLALPCDQELAEQVIAQAGWQIDRSVRRAELLAATTDDLLNAFYGPFWRDADVPDWFRLGLERLILPRPDAGALTVSQDAVRLSRVASLAGMARQPVGQPANALRAWRAQSYGMVLYIAERYGLDALYHLARDVGDYPDFASAFSDITGEPIDLLIPAWQTWLFTERAISTYGYSLYAPTTATPSMTPTATATRPPTTPTPTFTPAPEVTSTPRPTNTRIPPTATVTPLPAQGFVVRATQDPALITPEPQLTIPLPGGVRPEQGLILLVTFSLALVLLGVFFFMSRRRP